jgi:hypothetical protein
MTLCCYDLRYDCTAECAAAVVLPSAEEEGATKIVCIRLVRETSTAFAAKSDVSVDETPVTPSVSPTNVLLYR